MLEDQFEREGDFSPAGLVSPCTATRGTLKTFAANAVKASGQVESEMAHCGHLNQTTNHFMAD